VIFEVPPLIAAKVCHVVGNGYNFKKLGPVTYAPSTLQFGDKMF